MARKRNTFAKRQREIAKKQKAAEKRERRWAKKERKANPEEIEALDIFTSGEEEEASDTSASETE
jgi:hypothetical protein